MYQNYKKNFFIFIMSNYKLSKNYIKNPLITLNKTIKLY